MIPERPSTAIRVEAAIEECEINEVGAHHTDAEEVVTQRVQPSVTRNLVVLPHGDGVARAPPSVGRSLQLVCSLHYVLCANASHQLSPFPKGSLKLGAC